jgi:hypothetical protein
MSQNLLEVVENLNTTISADPDNTDNDEAVIQALQQALDQKMKRHVWFDGVEMPARKGKAPESILKHPDHAGAVRKTHNSAASPTTPLRTIVTAPTVTFPTIKNTAASDTSGPQYRYSTPWKTLPLPTKLSTVPWTSLCPSPSASSFPSLRKQYKELTTT